jgi:ADP-heptose:LPS heptosyltransferase
VSHPLSRPAASLLVLQALGLGDALTAIPALRGLRRAFPERSLVLAAPGLLGEWLRRLGVIDRVIPALGLQPLRLPPDLSADPGSLIAVNLHGRGPQSTQLLRATGAGRVIGFRDPAGGQQSGPSWVAQEHEVDRWCRLVRSVGGPWEREDLRLRPAPARAGVPASRGAPGQEGVGQYVVVHPGGASPSRRWPLQRGVEVVARVRESGREVIVTGSGPEIDLCVEICRHVAGVRNLAGALSLAGLAAVVADADLLICGDTGVAHLATAYATASVLLFGPASPQWWGPAIDPQRHHVLWKGASSFQGPGNPHGSRLDPALALVTVEEVISAAQHLLGARVG